MKRFLSVTLCVMMIASLFAVNVAAAPYTEGEVIFSQNYEDYNANSTFFSWGLLTEESEDSDNHVMALDVASEVNWQVNTPVFAINPGAKLTFKARVTEAGSLALKYEVFGGTHVDKEFNGVKFPTVDMEVGTWYDGEIIIRGATWGDYYFVNSGKLVHPTTGAVINAMVGGTLTSNGYTDPETQVYTPNYINRMRFLTHTNSGPDGNKVTDGSQKSSWQIDDVVLKTLVNVPYSGVYIEQDFDDTTNDFGFGRTSAMNPVVRTDRGLVMDWNYTSTNTYADLVGNTNLTDAQIPAAGVPVVLTLDLCKKAPAPGIVIQLPRVGESVKNASPVIATKQMRQDVWYSFAFLRGADGRISNGWRKVDGGNWVEMTGVAKDATIEAVTDTTDIANPVFINNGNLATHADRFRVLASSIESHTTLNAADTEYATAGTKLTGSHIMVDNVKLAYVNDVEAIFTNNAGAVKAEVTVNENRPVNTDAKKVFIGYYDEFGKLVDADFSAVANGEAELNLTAAGKAEMETAKLFVWDANNAPTLYSAWDITNNL